MNWKRMLATISGSVDQELLLRNEYRVTENRILKNQITGRLQLTDPEPISLAEIGQRLGRKALEEVAQSVRPETILDWHRRLVAKKFDGSRNRSPVGRPNTDNSIEELILKMARENRSWGYRRIVGALSNLGYELSHQTVGNVLERHGLLPAPDRERKTSWREFIRTHTEVLAAVDFFTAEVWTSAGLITYYVLVFIKAVTLPPRSPNLNAYCERWIRSVKTELLSKMILFGERSLRHCLENYVNHFHAERNHQGKSNVILFPAPEDRIGEMSGDIQTRQRLGGLVTFYYRDAA